MSATELDEVLASFERHLHDDLNLSIHSNRAYLGDLKSLIYHLQALGISDISKLELSHIRSWLATMQVKGGARTSLSRRAVSIRLFTRWALKSGLTSTDVGLALAIPKAHRTLPDVLDIPSDVAVMSARSCACGRGLRMLERVEGRRADTLRDADGNAVPGILLHVLFSDARTDMLKQFQAVQRGSGDVVLRVVRGSGFAREAFDGCVARLREHLRGASVEVEFFDFIPPAPSGKHRTVVVEPPIERDAPEDSAILDRTGS